MKELIPEILLFYTLISFLVGTKILVITAERETVTRGALILFILFPLSIFVLFLGGIVWVFVFISDEVGYEVKDWLDEPLIKSNNKK